MEFKVFSLIQAVWTAQVSIKSCFQHNIMIQRASCASVEARTPDPLYTWSRSQMCLFGYLLKKNETFSYFKVCFGVWIQNFSMWSQTVGSHCILYFVQNSSGPQMWFTQRHFKIRVTLFTVCITLLICNCALNARDRTLRLMRVCISSYNQWLRH